MAKLKRTNTITNYTVRSKRTKVDIRLDKRQKLEDKINNIMDVVDELNFQKNSEMYTMEEVKEQENFLKTLILEANISANRNKSKTISPALRKARIQRQISNLKLKMDFLKNAINQQKTNLIKHKEKKDKLNYELTKKFISKLESEVSEIKQKFSAYEKMLRLLKH